MTRKEKLRAVLKAAVPKFELSILTDKQLNDLEQIMKRKGLLYISINEAVQDGFKVPENPNKIINELIKFYKQ